MKKNKAFTMIELIFVIILIGIISSIALNNFDRSSRDQAIDHLLSSFRYTQYLAMLDNKMDSRIPLWQKSLWTIEFKKCGDDFYYNIGSDMSLNGSIEKNEAAVSPINRKSFFSPDGDCSKDYSFAESHLSKKLYITDIVFGANCKDNNSNAISFDYLGRPYSDVKSIVNSNYNKLLKNNCKITFSFDYGVQDIILTISRNTGHVGILNRDNI